jgi:hypothetical protein
MQQHRIIYTRFYESMQSLHQKLAETHMYFQRGKIQTLQFMEKRKPFFEKRRAFICS